MNSAPSSTISPAALKKARISQSTADDHHGGEEVKGDSLDHEIWVPLGFGWRLTVRCIGGKVRGDRALPAIAIIEQFRLVVDQLLAAFGREFEIRPLDHGIDRA